MQNIKKYEEEIGKLQRELGLDQIEFDSPYYDHLEIDIDFEFDDKDLEERYRQAIRSNYNSESKS